ncbi:MULTISPECIES: cytochrome c3 family protein [Shewanella]|uniref:Cytochrome c-type protein NrfB n=2 Tax=Shewanella TaxID=22 RepID=A0A6G7LM93_9GAMM|nr:MULTISPECIES: cytochrome c3 family protein [Shewanella]OIN17753.1 nitrite reductase [Shewanella algae]MBZ4678336.1 nitrite reductase [Shewanella sp.]MCA0950418.1 cytochrome c3 family protein [Shewanella chilikensis]MCE9789028.1 cytochrome c3 family protein [Shewanella chilikensis]MCE9790411.1 cytochrome c3 family protein [Shewanella indica]
MSSIRWRAILGAASMTCLLGVSGIAYAETALKINSDPCVKCHKRNGLMQGHHGQDQLNMSCSTCHGEKGKHPRKPNDLRVFTPQEGIAPATQNATCLKCHQPQKLAEKEWTHNVHADKLSCAACHKLHPLDDPMKQATGTQHSKLCRDCHTVN